MKKLVLASVSALALFGVAACSDATDNTTTQSVPETQMNEPAPMPADPATPAAPEVDNSTTQSIEPAPSVDENPHAVEPVPMEPAPAAPAPAE